MHVPLTESGREFAALSEMLQTRAQQFPTRTAFVFEDDAGLREQWSYEFVEARARTLGKWLSGKLSVGDRALLVYPPGLEFIAAFWGCIYAGVLPVPATYPKPRRPSPRLDSIATDCQPQLVLTHSSVIGRLCPEQHSPAISSLAWEPTDQIPNDPHCSFQPVTRNRDELAFLQYTSGSTSEPRGVMVSHGNILHNLSAIRAGFEIEIHAIDVVQGVFWLPAYHDLGLIGAILSPIYVGGSSTLIAPMTYLRKPNRWLELMSETKAAISGAPNFGYELAVRKSTPEQRSQLDLSQWRIAFCGAEPINHLTLEEFATAFAPAGFQYRAFFPCYGLAESTLFVTGSLLPEGPRVLHVDRAALGDHRVVCHTEQNGKTLSLVSCGPACPGLEFLIVDSRSRVPCQPDQVGEIWVQGDSIARGYWNQECANSEMFQARVAANGSQPRPEVNYLRTGDLGFRHESELFVTGRLKDVIIVRGRNHYPQDLERTAQVAHEAVDMGVAFSVDVDGSEQLVLVHQKRRECYQADLAEVMQAIRTAIVDEHEIDPQAIVLIRSTSLPITSSGKVQRSRCREMFLAGELEILAEWKNPNTGGEALVDVELPPLAAPQFLESLSQLSAAQVRPVLEAWLIHWLTRRANLESGAIQPGTPFAQLGIDSLSAVEMSQELDQLLGLQTPPMAMWSCSNSAELAEYLTGELHAAIR